MDWEQAKQLLNLINWDRLQDRPRDVILLVQMLSDSRYPVVYDRSREKWVWIWRV